MTHSNPEANPFDHDAHARRARAAATRELWLSIRERLHLPLARTVAGGR